jgi:hypothetical protein
MPHRLHDLVSFEMARRIARGLQDHPEWIDLARSNLHRWEEQNREADSLVRCYQEWRSILELPLHEVISVLMSQTDEGRRLRTNSPFVGILSPSEVWEIKRQIHATAAA